MHFNIQQQMFPKWDKRPDKHWESKTKKKTEKEKEGTESLAERFSLTGVENTEISSTPARLVIQQSLWVK